MQLLAHLVFILVGSLLIWTASAQTIPPTKARCPVGNALIAGKGHLVTCGCVPKTAKCPDNYFCLIREPDLPGYCCPGKFRGAEGLFETRWFGIGVLARRKCECDSSRRALLFAWWFHFGLA